MLSISIGIIIYKTKLYIDNMEYCHKHPEEQLCKNISLLNHLISLITNIFSIKIFLETLMIPINNILNCLINLNNKKDNQELSEGLIL